MSSEGRCPSHLKAFSFLKFKQVRAQSRKTTCCYRLRIRATIRYADYVHQGKLATTYAASNMSQSECTMKPVVYSSSHGFKYLPLISLQIQPSPSSP